MDQHGAAGVHVILVVVSEVDHREPRDGLHARRQGQQGRLDEHRRARWYYPDLLRKRASWNWPSLERPAGATPCLGARRPAGRQHHASGQGDRPVLPRGKATGRCNTMPRGASGQGDRPVHGQSPCLGARRPAGATPCLGARRPAGRHHPRCKFGRHSLGRAVSRW